MTCAGRAGRGGRAGRQGREAAGCAGRAQRERVVCAAWRPATWRGVASQKHTASKGVGVKPNCGECVVWKNWSATRRVGELEVVYFTLVLKAAAAKLPQLRRHCSGKLILLRWASVWWVSGRWWRWRRLGGIVGGSLVASRSCALLVVPKCRPPLAS